MSKKNPIESGEGAPSSGTVPPSSPRELRTASVAVTGASDPRTEVGPVALEEFEGASLDVGRGEPPEHLFRRLLGAYLAGAREFAVRERPKLTSGTRDVVRTFCRRTRQPEIISDEAEVLHLRDLAFESPIPLERRIARMGRLVVEFHREAVNSWGHLPFGEDGYWERRDDEIDRESWYVERVAAIRLNAATQGSEWLRLWTTARSLERIADHAVGLGEYGRRLVDLPDGVGPLTSLRQFHHQAMEHLEGVLNAEDGWQANDFLDLGEALIASGQSLSERLLPAVGGGSMAPATAAAVARILESISRTVAYAQDIAEVALDRWVPRSVLEEKAPGRRVAVYPPLSPQR